MDTTIAFSEDTGIISLFSSDQRIPEGIQIQGISVGGMTSEEAIHSLQNTFSDDALKQSMVIVYAESELILNPSETDAHWEVEKAVEEAMHGNSPDITLNFSVNESWIRDSLFHFFTNFGGIYSPSGFWVEGDSPDFDNMTGECQTIVINPGNKGLLLDLSDITDRILEAYRNNIFLVKISETDQVKEPKPLNLEEVFRLVSIAPVNPDLDRKTLEIIPGKKGYGFDIERAEKLLEANKDGGTIRLKMEYLEPTITEADVWFLDTLGYCKTEHNDNENRNENLRLACSKLNGLILQPGETLSYNDVLGKRTSEAGYKPAPAYSEVDLVDEIGGGICQVSSTLYLSSLFAELNVIDRRNHGYPASYIPLGLDATVNWGTTDLKIRNDYSLPVKILAEVSDGYVKIKIMGVDQRDYYVKMEYRVDDHPSYAAAYKCCYDIVTDELISRNLDHTSIYLDDVWCEPGFIQSALEDS